MPVFAHNPPVLTDHNAIRVGMDFDRTPDGAGRNRLLIVGLVL
jgi:hypothetical protein